jgi:hypothetical protein
MTKTEPAKSKLDKEFQDTTLRMTLHCVRNTVIEDYHAAGKLTQAEMKEFNKEIADKVYEFLQLFFSPYYKSYREHLSSIISFISPRIGTPKMNSKLLKLLGESAQAKT